MKRRKNGVGSVAIIAMLKNAQKGHAKTRLAVDIGIDAAHEAYLELLDVNRSLLAHTQFSPYLFFSQAIQDWGIPRSKLFIQKGNTLGERMHHAFNLVSTEKMLMIGSDCPYIDESLLEEAAHLLAEYDVVLGPSADGGYYLIGMKTFEEQLLQDIPWSTDQVLSATEAKCRLLGLSYTLLRTLEDVDDGPGWNRYLQWKEAKATS